MHDQKTEARGVKRKVVPNGEVTETHKLRRRLGDSGRTKLCGARLEGVPRFGTFLPPDAGSSGCLTAKDGTSSQQRLKLLPRVMKPSFMTATSLTNPDSVEARSHWMWDAAEFQNYLPAVMKSGPAPTFTAIQDRVGSQGVFQGSILITFVLSYQYSRAFQARSLHLHRVILSLIMKSGLS
jgi:hypothetical protein